VAELAAKAIAEKKGQEPLILDLRGVTLVADYFVIGSGTSPVQVEAIADRVEEILQERGIRPLRREGRQHGRWVLLDYGAVVVHIFHEEERKYYELERLWRDARITPREQ